MALRVIELQKDDSKLKKPKILLLPAEKPVVTVGVFLIP